MIAFPLGCYIDWILDRSAWLLDSSFHEQMDFSPLTAVVRMFGPMVRQRVRIRFCKRGDLRFIGHRDLVRTMERLFRRSDLRLEMSQGFHPKPKMSFPSALAVGIEGLDEVMELELAQRYTPDTMSSLLSRHSVPGLTFESVKVIPEGAKKAKVENLTYETHIPEDRRAQVKNQINAIIDMQTCPIQRTNKRSVDLMESLDSLKLADGMLSMRFRVRAQASAGPRDVLAVLGLDDLEKSGMCLKRTKVELST